jgi:hypothetical protein
LLHRAHSPGYHPQTLEAVERLSFEIYGDVVTKSRCAALRTLARTFYGDASRRSRAIPEVDALHHRMLWCVDSIREYLKPS